MTKKEQRSESEARKATGERRGGRIVKGNQRRLDTVRRGRHGRDVGGGEVGEYERGRLDRLVAVGVARRALERDGRLLARVASLASARRRRSLGGKVVVRMRIGRRQEANDRLLALDAHRRAW